MEKDLLGPIMRSDGCPPCSQLWDQTVIMAIVILRSLRMMTSEGEAARLLDLACFLSAYIVLNVINSLNACCSSVLGVLDGSG